MKRRGNCYVTSEAVYHLLGGKEAGWHPMRVQHEGDMHWYLEHRDGRILDLTTSQFRRRVPYWRGIGCGFLTRKPSRRAAAMMKLMVWQ